MPRDVNLGLSHPFGDQRRARERAANFFTLFELLKKTDAIKDAWARVNAVLAPDTKFESGVGAAIGRIDLDDAAILSVRQQVWSSFKWLRDSDIVLELGHEGYPSRLASIDNPPEFLFVRQEANVLEQPSLSIVGTRDASTEGLLRARKLAHLLSKRGITVCSGLARGIDEAAHRGALEYGGTTIAVIGTPLTQYYPKEHQPLQDQIGFVGAVVSQFYPGSKTLPLCFPLRNATMSGLSMGTVVIEASETSGALNQARKAIAQKRQLFIPKSAIDNPKLKWPTELRSKGAHVFSTIDELVEVLENASLLPREVSPHNIKANALTVNAS